jgi:pimeloyl-ACP methyl ester carboxylesterase
MTCVLPTKVLLICAVASAGWGACQQSNLTGGVQSSGAEYAVWMPEVSCWNGNMVVFAHGYVAPGSGLVVPPDQLSVGGVSLPATFNQLGYGFAASSYSKDGLAIIQGFEDTRDLVQSILRPKLDPHRIYLIGASEGGLVTALSAEQLPHVYNGAGAACGPIGSFQDQINYLGDFRVVFDYFFPGVLPPTPVNIPTEVMTDWATVYEPKIIAALAANPAAAAQLISVMQAPVTSDPASVAETVLAALWYNVFATNDATATLGGQPFDNRKRVYTGSANDALLNLKVSRFTESHAAREAVAEHYETSGRLNMPEVTLHTTGDPVIPYWQETLYTLKTVTAGTFLERTNLPVAAYGHCNFSAADLLAAFGILVLRDTGTNLHSDLQSALPEAHRADFSAAAERVGLPHE